MSHETRPIREILAQDHGITLRKCPRWGDHRRMVHDDSATVLGCCDCSTALPIARGEITRPCQCGHGPNDDRYEWEQPK